jgi:2-(1,2-epoxy-1,2-dihydrophenyl)acetyl-CoA isomerase
LVATGFARIVGVPALMERDGVRVTPGRVAIVELRRPPDNYFDVALVTALVQALEALAGDGACRAAVLCSEGKHFCAGWRFAEGAGTTATAQGGGDMYSTAARLWDQPLPIVAAVQGAAVGGGAGLALAADFRVASPTTRFSVNFARLGLHHGFGISATLPRVVGPQRALELMYTGKRIGGEEAYRIGLCDRLVDAEVVRHEAIALAEEIAAAAPLAVRSIRQTMRGDLPDLIRAALARELGEQQRLIDTADFSEGVRAVSERRAPRFIGA